MRRTLPRRTRRRIKACGMKARKEKKTRLKVATNREAEEHEERKRRKRERKKENYMKNHKENSLITILFDFFIETRSFFFSVIEETPNDSMI